LDDVNDDDDNNGDDDDKSNYKKYEIKLQPCSECFIFSFV
jgi:hypothetical protein